MVRLKQIYTHILNLEKLASQFHYGSIKTLELKKFQNWATKGLNSTMVRLKLLHTERIRKAIAESLNSTMVRLKPRLGNKSIARWHSLNSTMVRLKQEC